ncbi:MAG: GNAT family N-acetyltransferase [Pseudomonadota bacterium]
MMCYAFAVDRSLAYDFRRVGWADLSQLQSWEQQPHVQEWWDSDDPIDAQDLADPRCALWIVSYKGRPFAFLQDYTVHGWPNHPFADLPKGTRGIDQYIGEPDMLGKGHGTGLIQQRMDVLFHEGAPMIAIDPHPDNARAIAVYRKLGFAPMGPPQKTEWGPILPMVARP